MAGRRNRILYVQYTNPAGYPPLEHCSRILADRGMVVRFLGAAAFGADRLAFPSHELIRVQGLPSFGGGLLQRVNYAVFLLWTVFVALIWRPRWVYASEPMSAPAALAIQKLAGCQTLYHEHDSPSYGVGMSRFQRLFSWAREELARTADLCVLPQQQRLDAFVAETGRTGPTHCVWNCPRREEIRPARASWPASEIRSATTFYYHGNVSPALVPLTLIDALSQCPPNSRLLVVGYETIGARGHVDALSIKAKALGVADRFTYRGPLSRYQLMAAAAEGDVGLAFMPPASHDLNVRHMVGASNKVFDYLAVGMMLLVSEIDEWRQAFVVPGYARACDPSDVDSLAAAMRWCIEAPDEVRAMGERGRRRIADEWHYERQFEVVAEALTARSRR